MATSPANASAIKYAVMSFSLDLNESCGMIASRNHFKREPYLRETEAACGRELGPTPRAGAFARTGQ
jgi:hypothetical protein